MKHLNTAAIYLFKMKLLAAYNELRDRRALKEVSSILDMSFVEAE